MFCQNWFYYDLRVCTELQVLSKTASCLWFYAYKKYKNGHSARRTYLQRHIWPAICSSGSDNFCSGISGKLPKIATSNVIFLEISWSYRRKILHDNLEDIKPNDIFQNYVHSTSTLRITFEPWLFGLSYFTFTCLVTRSRSLTLYHYWYAPGMDF